MMRRYLAVVLWLLLTLVSGSAYASNFSVSGGFLHDPTGAKFIPEGTGIYDYNMAQIIQNSSGFPVTTLFPHINYIRVMVCAGGDCAINGSSGGSQPTSITYPPASNYAQMATWCQDNKIVCEFEDHTSNGGLWEGSNLPDTDGVTSEAPTGSLLTSVTTFWASMATQFIGNPYAWIGSINELGVAAYTQASISAQSTYHLALYNAIRATGNNNIIDLCGGNGCSDPGTMGPNALNASDYANMTNVMWLIHEYDPASNSVATVQANMAGSTSATGGGPGCNGYLCQQQIQSKDGVMPVIFNEYGPTSADAASTDGANIATAVQSLQSLGIGGAGFVYFNPNGGTTANNFTQVNNGGTSGLTIGSGGGQYNLDTWGSEVAAVIAANPFPGGTGGFSAPATVTTSQSVGVAISGLSVADANSGDTMSFTGTSGGSGKLTATGATGNGTGTITFSGTLTALNNLLATVTFQDAVAESVTLNWSVSDQHSNTYTASTAATTTGPVSPNCSVVTTVGPTLTSAGPPVATWAITSGGQLSYNGSAIAGTANVIEIAYVNGVIWQKNSAGNWYNTSPTGGPGTIGPTTTDPTVGCTGGGNSCAPSGNNSTLAAGTAAVLTDSYGNGWGLPTGGGKVFLNSTGLSTTSNAVELAYVNGVMWYENSSSQWFSFNSSQAIIAGTQTAIASGPTNSPLSGETLTIATISNQTIGSSFTVSGQISGTSSTPTLNYKINNGSFAPLPSGFTSSTTAYSFTVPPINTASSSNTITVEDVNNTSAIATSNAFSVGGPCIVSVNNTVANSGTTSVLCDNRTNIWTVPAANGPVYLNTTAFSGTANTSEIAYVNNIVWQEVGGVWSYFLPPASSNGSFTIGSSFAYSPVSGPSLIVSPASLIVSQSVSTGASGVSVSDSANPNDTMSLTARSSGSGVLSAMGATGNGTSTITYSGTVAAVNNAMTTLVFRDTVAETPTLYFTVSDQHSNISTVPTGVTVNANVPVPCLAQ